MNFESGLLLYLGLLFIVPVFYFLTRLVNWIAGRKLIPLWLLIALIVAALVFGSLYLDNAGTVTPVKLVNKKEIINYKRNGSWNRQLSLDVEYQPPDELVSTQLTLGCDAATFDSLRVGQTVEARVLEFGRHFKFARLKNRSTFSLVSGLIPRNPRGTVAADDSGRTRGQTCHRVFLSPQRALASALAFRHRSTRFYARRSGGRRHRGRRSRGCERPRVEKRRLRTDHLA